MNKEVKLEKPLVVIERSQMTAIHTPATNWPCTNTKCSMSETRTLTSYKRTHQE